MLASPEVLAGLGQKWLEVNVRVPLLEAEDLEQPLLGQLRLPDLLEYLQQRLVVALGEPRHLLLHRATAVDEPMHNTALWSLLSTILTVTTLRALTSWPPSGSSATPRFQQDQHDDVD